MTSKLVVNTIEADTGISSVSFASSISLSSTSVFHLGDAGFNIGADTNISRAGNGILAFNINSSEKVRINSTGDLQFSTGSRTGNVNSICAANGHSLDFNGTEYLYFRTAATERLRIKSNGYVGVNETNPQYPLHVAGATTTSNPTGTGILMGLQHDHALIHLNAADDKGAIIDFSVPGQDRRGGLLYYFNNNPTVNDRDALAIHTAASEKLRITSGGNLAINNIHGVKKVHISTTGNQKVLIDPNYNNNSGGSSNSEANANNIVESILIRTSFGENAGSQTNAGHKWGIKFQGYNGNDFTQAISKCAGVFAVSEDAAGGYNRNVGLAFHTSPYNTNHREVMRINTNGAVTKPYQYVFVVATSSFSKNNNWQKITGMSIQSAQCTGVADGTNWSNSTQRFTAPVTGTYYFYCGGWAASASTGQRYAYAFKHTNGNNYQYISGGSYCANDSPMDGWSRTIKLSAGEWVELWAFSAVSTTWGGGHNFYWGGYLLG